mmetsp:Transcript_5436/g.22984  ORF Transcript_5436/g.22984 Transcript_5436/m.22984 type:complete len:276 (-) Transcript_5436:2734-3561(-)
MRACLITRGSGCTACDAGLPGTVVLPQPSRAPESWGGSVWLGSTATFAAKRESQGWWPVVAAPLSKGSGPLGDDDAGSMLTCKQPRTSEDFVKARTKGTIERIAVLSALACTHRDAPVGRTPAKEQEPHRTQAVPCCPTENGGACHHERWRWSGVSPRLHSRSGSLASLAQARPSPPESIPSMRMTHRTARTCSVGCESQAGASSTPTDATATSTRSPRQGTGPSGAAMLRGGELAVTSAEMPKAKRAYRSDGWWSSAKASRSALRKPAARCVDA